MYRRRRYEDEEDNHDRWLISYADFITLLFAFFVVMYATSTINLNKYQALSSAVVTAFQGQPGQTPSMDIEHPSSLQNQSAILKPLPLNYLYQEKKQRDQEKMYAIGQQLANVLAAWIEQKKIMVTQGEFGIDIVLLSSFLFKSDGTTLSDQAPYVLKLIGGQLAKEQRNIQVEGHMDSHMFAQQISPDIRRWEMTSAQAARVVAILNMRGIPNKRLSASGLADTRPAFSSENDLAQAMNNRVVIRVLTAESNAQQASNNIMLLKIEPGDPDTAPPQEAPVVTPGKP